MLRLFSSVRKTLINEGKTSRYVRYAIGEIVLIVVGILIALQISEWNQGRVDAKLRADSIDRLLNDIDLDRVFINNVIRVAEMRMQSIEFLMSVSEDTTLAVQNPVEFVYAVVQAALFGQVTLSSDTMEELRSSGNLRLLSANYKELQYLLLRYYKLNETIRERVDDNRDIRMKYLELTAELLPSEKELWLLNNLSWYYQENRSVKDLDFPFTDEEILDVAERFAADKRIFSWLPEVWDRQRLIRTLHNRILDRAEELHTALKLRQADN